MKRKSILSAVVVILAILMYMIAERAIPSLDRRADNYFIDTTTDAALAYTTVRGVNAIVSVVKDSAIDVSPAGVGLTIAAGQILDPIDDLTERLSAVLVTALASLGLQKLLLEIGKQLPIWVFPAVFLLMIIPAWMTPGKRRSAATILLAKGVALVAIARLLMPISSLVSDHAYQALLKDDLLAAKQQLSTLSIGQETIAGLYEAEESGLLATLSHSAKEAIDNTRRLYHRISENSDRIVNALLQLTTLYISLFVVQVIIIPLAMLWVLWRLVNSLFNTTIATGSDAPPYHADCPIRHDLHGKKPAERGEDTHGP